MSSSRGRRTGSVRWWWGAVATIALLSLLPVLATPAGAATPSAPTSVTAVGMATFARVSWQPPADDGGAEIEAYVVTTSPGGRTTFTSPDVLHADVIGLEPGSEHTFTVRAFGDEGLGAASAPVGPVTIGPPVVDFSDVADDHPFAAEIDWMAGAGFSTGYADGTFQPGGTLSRQAMAAFLYRAGGSPDGPDPTCATDPFADVPAGHPFCGEIAWLVDRGIATGYDGNLFQPEAGLSRQAMAAFLYRAAGSPDGPDPTCGRDPFVDVPRDHPFCGEIAWMAEQGIADGYDDGTYLPEATLTRQAMSAFLHRYLLLEPSVG